MSKNKIAIIIIGILAIILGIGLFLNSGIVKENKETFANVELKIIDAGTEVGVITYDEIVALGAEEYEAIYDTSKTDPIVETYKGVELKKILEHFDISMESKSSVVLTAVDNFAMAYTIEEVMQDENIYVTYERNGERIKGRDEDGSGPLVAIVKTDQFSNRRCKWMISVEVN